MVALTFSRIFLGFAVLLCLFTTAACVVTSCPSPSVVYASKGDNVTLCWRLPENYTLTQLFRIHVVALSRPVDEEMKRIATANQTGHLVRELKKNHKGLYFGRVKLRADLKKGFFYFTILNYTSGLANIYCLEFQMTGVNDIKACHVTSITVRDYPGDEFFSITPTVKAPATNAGCVVTSCPSPSVVYASKGDNVTLCWRLPENYTQTQLFHIHAVALSRPVDKEMMRIATANQTGHLVREFKKYHKGLYFGRVKLRADLKKGFFYFTILNYTSGLANIYCLGFQMTGVNDIKACHVTSITVRDYPGDEFFITTPTVKAPATYGERASDYQTYKIPFIVAVTVVGILAILLAVVFLLYCRVSQKKIIL